jgi:hypothetical protein|tara:strand:+ start:237 stop:428 length:192 start_codon:yes stop_codon:yes gene_type:complete
MNYQTLVFGDRYFKLVRTLKEEEKFVKGLDDLKQHFHCDTVLRKEGLLYFCRDIKDIECETIH